MIAPPTDLPAWALRLIAACGLATLALVVRAACCWRFDTDETRRDMAPDFQSPRTR